MALISFCSETLYGATSFGPAITFNVGWQICFLLHLCDGTLTSVAVNMMKMAAVLSISMSWPFS